MEYQEIKLKKYRERWVYSVLGFIFVGGELHYTGKLFDLVLIREEKIKYRYLHFDEWYYQNVWGEWHYKFRLKEIL
jgi:hypothetical protein